MRNNLSFYLHLLILLSQPDPIKMKKQVSSKILLFIDCIKMIIKLNFTIPILFITAFMVLGTGYITGQEKIKVTFDNESHITLKTIDPDSRFSTTKLSNLINSELSPSSVLKLQTIGNAPDVKFEADNVNIYVDGRVNFTDESYFEPTSWQWYFEGGDPEYSTEQHPSVIYKEPGIYDVSLTASNTYGENSKTYEDYIKVLCGPFAYIPEEAQNVLGSYHDLKNDGLEIPVTNYDNCNSNPIDIGFEFEYECEVFTQFILNTNGFIKLGIIPPTPNLFFDAANGFENGLFHSTKPEDIYLIAAFNHDLKGGDNPEFRVKTSGFAPNRICTIQFKDLKEKTSYPSRQYEYMEFQIKLYETSNIIEVIFGNWIASNFSSASKSAVCGLKGDGSKLYDIIAVSHIDYEDWSKASFIRKRYTCAVDGFTFGKPSQRKKPDVGRTFRFIPKKKWDAMVYGFYPQCTSSIYNSAPQIIEAYVTNNGLNTLLDTEFILEITGDNTYSEKITIPMLNPGKTELIVFENYEPTFIGSSTMRVKIPKADDENSNNTMQTTQTTTVQKMNYCNDDDPYDALGIDKDTEGVLFTKYYTIGTSIINSIQVYVTNHEENVGQSIYGMILDHQTNIVGLTENLVIKDEHLGNWVTIPFEDEVKLTYQYYLAGIGMKKSTNGKDYSVLGGQWEDPPRPSAYYFYNVTENTFYNVSYTYKHRYMIGLTVSMPWIENSLSSEANQVCEGEHVILTFDYDSTDFTWWKSLDGVGKWEKLSDNWDNIKEISTDAIYENTHFMTIVNMEDGNFMYSNISEIKVNPVFEIEEYFEICQGEDFIYPDGYVHYDLQSDTTYTSSIESISGCDSIVITFVEVLKEPYHFEEVFLCGGDNYTFPDQSIVLGIKSDTIQLSYLTAVNGCDSIVETYVTVIETYETPIETSLCFGDSYVFPDGDVLNNITNSLIDTSYLSTQDGCDSTIYTNIQVTNIDAELSFEDGVLYAFPDWLEYIWVDCDDQFSVIEGEEDNQFSPYFNGNYAAIISDGMCIDTSNCQYLIGSSIDGLAQKEISVYPNPVDSKLLIYSNHEIIKKCELISTNAAWSELYFPKLNMEDQYYIDVSNVNSGLYILKIYGKKDIYFNMIVILKSD